MVGFAGQVFDVEAPGKGTLFKSEQSGVDYLVQRAVAKYFDQGLVISDHDEVITTLGEVASLLKAPSDSQGFAFDGRVALFRRGQEP